MRARIILITGDGKGKTTSALGTALRAAGHGMKSIAVQFVKSDTSTGEIAGISYLPGAQIVVAGRGFIPRRSNPNFIEHREAARSALKIAGEAMSSSCWDMIILDEIAVAVSSGLLEEADVLSVIKRADPAKTVIMTGRGATPGLIEIADTISEIRSIKHCFQSGRQAQKGVEY